MSIQHKIAGPVLIKYNAVSLGYSRDGVNIRIEPKWGDIFSDDYGGAGGAPADTQMLGAIALVTAEMPKYESSELHKLASFEKAGTVGILPQLGTLIRQESEYATLLLDGKNEDWTFTIAFMRQAQEVNKGTKFSTYVVGWECWISDTTTRTLFAVA